MFWPSTQLANGTKSAPKPPEITITGPSNDVWHKANVVKFKGYANDVSNMRESKVCFIVDYQADASPPPASIEFPVVYFSGPNNETTFDDSHCFAYDGHYRVRVDSYDGAGNHANAFMNGDTEFRVKVDTKKPTATITISVNP